MAKNKAKIKSKAKTKAHKKGKKKKGGWQAQVFLVMGILMAGVFMPSTVLLLVGMLPTFVAFFADRSKKKNKGFTVGSLNLAGCTPFLLDLWAQGHSFDKALFIISDPLAIIVMYSAAGVGYLIDWAMTGLVSTLLYDRAKSRKKSIAKQQEELVKRWGNEVTGTVQLDEHGFAVEPEEKEKSE